MLAATSKFGFFTASILGFSVLASSVAVAVDAGSSAPPRKHVVSKPVASTKAEIKSLDCGPVIYDYGGTKETKTVCSLPWTGPKASAESGPVGSSSSASQ